MWMPRPTPHVAIKRDLFCGIRAASEFRILEQGIQAITVYQRAVLEFAPFCNDWQTHPVPQNLLST